jgi:hypothetical protein
MTKKEILEILRDVFFVDYRITEEENSKLSKIYINKKIGPYFFSVFTYNPDANSPESVWYFSIYFNKDNHEIMIPTGMERDFCEDFLLLYNDVESAMSKVDEVANEIREVKWDVMKNKPKLLSKYRDRKLEKLGI